MIETYFRAIAQVYAEHGEESPHSFQLRPGATREELGRASSAIGTELDARLRALWEHANGSDGAPVVHDGELLFGYALLSIDEALSMRSAFERRAPQYEPSSDRDPRVGKGWFSTGWLPFAAEHDHAVLLVDHTPLGSGAAGQVIRYVHDPDRIEHVADSITELLEESLEAIQEDPLELLGVF